MPKPRIPGTSSNVSWLKNATARNPCNGAGRIGAAAAPHFPFLAPFFLGGSAGRVPFVKASPPSFALVHHDVVAGDEVAGEELRGERVLDHPLDGPLERPGAVDRVVAGVGDGLARLLAELERELPLGEQLAQPAELDLDDAARGPRGRAAGRPPSRRPGSGTRAGTRRAGAPWPPRASPAPASGRRAQPLDVLGADVGGHDDHGVAEVDGAPLPVGEPAVVEDLEEAR